MLNQKPTGWLVILGDDNDQAEPGVTLTARTGALQDKDGLGELSFQWKRDGTAIDGATDETYTVVDEDLGSNISFTVSYIDGAGHHEVVDSRDEVGVPFPGGFYERLYLKHIGAIDPKGLAWWRTRSEAWFVAAAKRDGTLK